MAFAPAFHSAPAEIKAFIDYGINQGVTQSSLLQHWLRCATNPLAPLPLLYNLCDARLVCLDLE